MPAAISAFLDGCSSRLIGQAGANEPLHDGTLYRKHQIRMKRCCDSFSYEVKAVGEGRKAGVRWH